MMTNWSDRVAAKPRGPQRFERDDVIRNRLANFVRASSHTVLPGQAEQMDALERRISLNEAIAL